MVVCSLEDEERSQNLSEVKILSQGDTDRMTELKHRWRQGGLESVSMGTVLTQWERQASPSWQFIIVYIGLAL